MINKLRKRIFWIIQLSFTVIIVGITTLFITSSYKNTITASIMLLDRLEMDVDTTLEMFNPFFIEIDGIYKLHIKNNMIVRETSGVPEEVKEYAGKIINKSADTGYIGKYIYKIRRLGNDTKEVTLMENENAIRRLKVTTIYAYSLCFLGVIIIYIIAKGVSKFIVKPVEKAFEKQKQFISDASHELKTPLAVIEANADVLQDKVGDNKWITYIQNEVQSMNKLVNDLLVLAKMENVNTVNIQNYNLSQEIQMFVSGFESIIYENGIKLENNIEKDIYCSCEKEDIKHIISIILDNAIKHTKKDDKIIVNLNKLKNDVVIEIVNQGEPIPEDEQEKIFERFYRVDKSRNRNEKRYGLGLAIAKEIVEKYNGSIKASSKNGFTSFVVKFNTKFLN